MGGDYKSSGVTKYPVILAATAAALLSGYTYRAAGPRPTTAPASPSASPGPSALGKALCPRGTLPDQGVCIPVPRPEVREQAEPGDRIPRRPDRDADYAHYRLPVEGAPRAATTEDGAPETSSMLAVVSRSGAEVHAPPLEGQDGSAEVLSRGPLVGTTLALHVRAGDARRDYIVLIGNLESAAPLDRGAVVAPNAVVGRAGSRPVLWAARLLRPGVDPNALSPEDLIGEASAVWVDPRNVLPLGH